MYKCECTVHCCVRRKLQEENKQLQYQWIATISMLNCMLSADSFNYACNVLFICETYTVIISLYFSLSSATNNIWILLFILCRACKRIPIPPVVSVINCFRKVEPKTKRKSEFSLFAIESVWLVPNGRLYS